MPFGGAAAGWLDAPFQLPRLINWDLHPVRVWLPKSEDYGQALFFRIPWILEELFILLVLKQRSQAGITEPLSFHPPIPIGPISTSFEFVQVVDSVARVP